jgi:hypothetical protein
MRVRGCSYCWCGRKGAQGWIQSQQGIRRIERQQGLGVVAMVHIVKASKSRGLGPTLLFSCRSSCWVICLGHAVDPVAVIRLLQQFVNAKSIQIGGQLYLLVDCLEGTTRPLQVRVRVHFHWWCSASSQTTGMGTVMTAGTRVKQTGLQCAIGTFLQDLGDGFPGCHTNMWIPLQVQSSQ